MKDYPAFGDIIRINFDPQSGNEVKKKRPALVISCDTFNQKTGMAVVCPITSTKRSYPLRVPLDSRTATQGYVMCEQIKSVDYTARSWKFFEKAPREVIDEVVKIVGDIIGR